MSTDHIHAVCQFDAPLDSVVGIMSGAMAAELRMTPRIVKLVRNDPPTADDLDWQRAKLGSLVADPGVGAISFAYSPRGTLERVDFEKLAVRRAESVTSTLLAVAYCTTLWAGDAVDLLEVAVPASGDVVQYLVAVVASFDPDAEYGPAMEPTPVPLLLISRTAGVRVRSMREFAYACRRATQHKGDSDTDHLSESLVDRLTMQDEHGLTQAAWNAAVTHLMSCDMCGEKSRYYALNSRFLTSNIPA